MPFSRERFEVTQYLGNQVGKKDKFLNTIALMETEWRELRAFLEVIDIIQPLNDKVLTSEEKTQLKIVKEIVERIGQANFNMDVVSHLAMKIGKAYKIYDGE